MLARYPHALVDILDPTQTFSAAAFVEAADIAVRRSLASGRTPLLVGGTMLYFRAFKHGINDLPTADTALRARIARRAAKAGWPALHSELAARDPAAAARIDAHNGQRIQRALEVIETTGRSITEAWAQGTTPAEARLGCELTEVAILPCDRPALHRRIGERLDAMLDQGLVDEVAALRADPALSAEHPSMRSVGYRQVWRHLDGCYGRDEMVRRIAAATRQVAKRQLTWLRRWSGLTAAVENSAAAANAVANARAQARLP